MNSVEILGCSHLRFRSPDKVLNGVSSDFNDFGKERKKFIVAGNH